MRTIEQMKLILLTVRNTYSLNNLSNWSDEKVTEMSAPERNMVCSPNKSNPTFPQIWWKSVVVQEWIFPLKWNMKSSRKKSNRRFPQIWWSQWVTLQLWGGFLTLCEEKNTRKPAQKWIQMHGRANQSFPPSLVPNKSLNLAYTFSASAHRG